jgi:GNAT superfamily N-acetyltransferase
MEINGSAQAHGCTEAEVVITARRVGEHCVFRCGSEAWRTIAKDDYNADSDFVDIRLDVFDYFLSLRGASIGLLQFAMPPHAQHTVLPAGSGLRVLQERREEQQWKWTRALVKAGIQQIRVLNVAHGWQASRVCLPAGESLADVPGCEPRAVFRYTMTKEQLAAAAKVERTDPPIIREACAADYEQWRSSFLKYGPTQIPDWPSLREDELQTAFSHYATHDKRRSGLLLACEADSGELMGFAMLSMFENAAGTEHASDSPGPEWCYLKDLWVEEAARRRRVGGALVDASSAWALEREASGMRWFCIKSNDAGVAFYERLGATRDCDNCWHINTVETVSREDFVAQQERSQREFIKNEIP